MTLEIYNNMARLNLLMGSKPSAFLYLGFQRQSYSHKMPFLFKWKEMKTGLQYFEWIAINT